jgi:DNA-binding response OmpR family regulator
MGGNATGRREDRKILGFSEFPSRTFLFLFLSKSSHNVGLGFPDDPPFHVIAAEAAAGGSMSRGQVVVLEDDDWVARLLETGLREHGYEVATVGEALSGFQRVCQLEPDCIVCDVTLPDFDGYWVAQQVRAAPAKVSATPLLFLGPMDDEGASLRGLQVGADALVTKPFRMDEVIAQVDALVDMAKRLQKTRASISQRPMPPADALTGNIEEMSIVTVLMVLEMERRSGQLKVTSGPLAATIELCSGYASGGTLKGEGKDLVPVLREVLSWKTGVFSFAVGPDVPAPQRKRTIAGMLVEAVLPPGNPGRPAEGERR